MGGLKKIFPNKVWHFLLAVAASLILCSPLILIAQNFDKDLFPHIFFFCFASVILAIFIFFNKTANNATHSIVRPSFNSHFWKTGGIIIIVTLFIIPSFNSVAFKSLGPPALPSGYTVAGALLLAPLLEEIIFRKYLLSGLLTNYSHNVSISLTSVLFSLFHIHPAKLFSSFLLGLIFSHFFYKTRNVGSVVLLHLLSNLSVLLSSLLRYHCPWINTFYTNYHILVFVIACTAGVCIWKRIWKTET